MPSWIPKTKPNWGRLVSFFCPQLDSWYQKKCLDYRKEAWLGHADTNLYPRQLSKTLCWGEVLNMKRREWVIYQKQYRWKCDLEFTVYFIVFLSFWMFWWSVRLWAGWAMGRDNLLCFWDICIVLDLQFNDYCANLSTKIWANMSFWVLYAG